MNLCRSRAMTANVYEEKKTVTAGEVLEILHKIQVSVPNGQYFFKMPIKVIGMANRHNEVSATAKVAMKMFRAVLISEMVN